MIGITKAPPFATIQDRGWQVGRAMGLPRSGAMDVAGLERANALAGNPADAAVIEWALGAGTIQCDGAATIGISGWGEVRQDGREVPDEHGARRVRVPAGGALTLAPHPKWRFLYVAVRGGIDVPLLMGSRSTYLPGGFGGHEGRRLRTGDRLPVGPAPEPGAQAGLQPPPLDPPGGDVLLRVTPGPQWEHFDDDARNRFFGERFVVSTASDRMGYRLSGTRIAPKSPADLPSEPACPGAVQVPGGGEPIVLMPDGPTVGGYPKLVVVRRADLGRLAQCPPGAVIRFRLDG